MELLLKLSRLNICAVFFEKLLLLVEKTLQSFWRFRRNNSRKFREIEPEFGDCVQHRRYFVRRKMTCHFFATDFTKKNLKLVCFCQVPFFENIVDIVICFEKIFRFKLLNFNFLLQILN
jgi:hypothetical protein